MKINICSVTTSIQEVINETIVNKRIMYFKTNAENITEMEEY